MTKNGMRHLKRILSVVLIAALTAGGLYFTAQKQVIEAEAADDALLSIQQIRNEILANSGTKYSILEVVPDHSLAQLGYTIAGSEPFPVLYDSATGSYLPWADKLVQYATKEERVAFMTELASEADQVLTSVKPDYATASADTLPFSFETYNEVSDLSEVAEDDNRTYYEVKQNAVQTRGRFVLTDSTATDLWRVTFSAVTGTSVRLIDVNQGTGTVYYKVVSDSVNQLTYGAWKDLATNKGDYPLYVLNTDGSYTYVGEARTMWNSLLESVSYNDSVSSNELSSYFTLKFQYVTNNSENQAAIGDVVYIANLDTCRISANGEYEFEATYEDQGQAGDTLATGGESFYYCGGLYNNNLFLKQVFGLDPVNEIPYFGIEVYVVTPSQLNTIISNTDSSAGRLLSEFDFVSVVAGGTARVTVENADFGTTGWALNTDGTASTEKLTAYYSTGNDLSIENAQTFALHLYQEKIPVQVDVSDRFVSNGTGVTIASTATDTNFTRAINFQLLSESAVTGQLSKTGLLNADGNAFSSTNNFQRLTNANVVASFAPDTEHDLMFIRDSAWFFNGISVPLLQVTGFMDYLYGSDKNDAAGHIAGGLSDVVNLIVQENLERDSDVAYTSEDRISTDVYDATIIRHIMSASSLAKVKTSLNILVIEPATSTYSAESGLTKAKFAALTGVNQGNITITCMPINLFIGKIDDLNTEYDIIYFGGSTTGLTTNSGGVTVYNDSSMNGLLYSNIGDTIHDKPVSSGYLITDYTNNAGSGTIDSSTVHRFTGNDLSREAFNKLLDYRYAYYPIIIDEKLLTVSGSSFTINGDRVDNSSYLYEFLDLVKNDKNVFASGQLNGATGYTDKSALFKYYANRSKLNLESSYENCLEIGTTLSDGTSAYYTVGNVANTDVKILNASSDGKYYIPYNFTIRNTGAVKTDTKYVCKVYIDTNADGKFSGVNEKVAQYEELSADIPISLKVGIASDYYGCITWKLEVCQADNEYVRNSCVGYLKLRPLEKVSDEQKTIRILQVHMGSTSSGKLIDLQATFGKWTGSAYVDYSTTEYAYAGYKTNYFRELAQQIKDDYILNVTTTSLSDWSKNEYSISDFDMLILGFSDAFENNDLSTWQTEFVKEFIQSGKSVMFAHDMTSYQALPDSYKNSAYSGEWMWGYQMNQYIRSYVGLDIYGVSNSEYNKNQAALYRGVAYTRATNGILTNGKYTLTEPSKDTTSRDGLYYNYSGQDVAYDAKSGRSITVPEVQGYSYTFLETHKASGYSDQNYMNSYCSSGSRFLTQTISKVNSGQITTFPFNLDSSDFLNIARTHNQYYALDMSGDSDVDGQADIVVWYDLTNTSVGKFADGDVKNDYYLYSKANILYTGMGHYAGHDGQTNYKTAVTQEEAKLFLNAMIASYNSGIRTPSLTVRDATSDAETNVMLGYFDADLGIALNASSDTSVTVRFTISDLNMQGTKKGTVRFFKESATAGDVTLTSTTGGSTTLSSVEEITDAYDVYLWDDYKKYLNGTITLAELETKKVSKSELENGVEYCVTVNLSEFSAGIETEEGSSLSNFDSQFYIAVQDKITVKTSLGGTVENTTPWGVKAVTYTTVELFDLD